MSTSTPGHLQVGTFSPQNCMLRVFGSFFFLRGGGTKVFSL